jgi:hypothetical protein
MIKARSYKLRHVPLRLATGAYILNAGLGKRSLPDEAAAGMQAGAATVVPLVKDWEPSVFGKALSTTEITVGSLLLAPFVPSGLAGAVLASFSGGLLRMYWRNPAMHEPGSPRPTQQGSAVAKDVWMFGIGTSLLIDACLTRRTRHRCAH